MLQLNSPGRPLTLTEEIKQRILNAVPKVIIPAQVAYLSRIPKQSLSRWLIQGEKDSNEGIDSIYAQLWDDFKEEQSKVTADCLIRLRECPKNYGALIAVLEKCFKDDFEKKSDSQQIAEDLAFKVIAPLLVSKGVDIDGIIKKVQEGRTEAQET